MPHVQATGAPVSVDYGITVTKQSSINVDLNWPLVAAAVAAGQLTILDSATAPSVPGLGGISRGPWAANTTYKQNDVVSYAGSFWTAKSDFTSGASFNAANWNQSTVAAGTELGVTEITNTFGVTRANGTNLSNGKMFDGFSGDTGYAEINGLTLPALAAQDRPVDLALILNGFQIGAANYNITVEVVKQTAQLATPSAAAVDALVSGGNCYISRIVTLIAAFAAHSQTFRRRIPPGTAVPALKMRYKGSAAVNGAATLGFGVLAGVPVARLEYIAR